MNRLSKPAKHCAAIIWKTRKEKRPLVVDLPLSILKSQGLVFGTHSIIEGAQQFRQEDDVEKALTKAAEALENETTTIVALEKQFRYLSCVPGEQKLPRGRLTYIDLGGGCSRIMVASFYDNQNQAQVLKSESSNVLRLPDGATLVKVFFQVKGGPTVKKVNRSDPKQPGELTRTNTALISLTLILGMVSMSSL